MSTERHEITGDDHLAEENAKKAEELIHPSSVEGTKKPPEVHDHTDRERQRLHPNPNDPNNPNNIHK